MQTREQIDYIYNLIDYLYKACATATAKSLRATTTVSKTTETV